MTIAGHFQRAQGNSQSGVLIFPVRTGSRSRSFGGTAEWKSMASSSSVGRLTHDCGAEDVLMEERGEKWEVAHNATIKTKSRD